MKSFRSFAILFGIGLVALLALASLGGLPTGASDPSPTQEPRDSGLTPAEATAQFYAWYLDYVGTRSSDSMRNPLVDKAYRDSEYLTEEFIQAVDAMLASMSGGGFDPFLCAQDLPEWVEATEVAREGERATVLTRSSFEGHAFTVELCERDGQWLITEIRCR